jgi:DNA polymerase-3 subunit gamma/tau
MAAAADASDPEAAEVARLSAALPADETQLLYSICLHGRADLGLAPDEYAALTMVLLRLLAFKPAASEGGAAASAEKKTLTRPETAPTPTPVAAAQPAAASLPVAPPPAPSLAPAPSAAAAPVAAAAPAVAQPPQPVPPVPTPVQSAAAPAPVAESVPPWEEDSSNEPPPWPDADDGSVPTTPAVPPVRMAEKVERNLPPVQAEKAQAAPELVAIPVREASEPSERLQPLPLSAPTPVSARYTPTEEGDVWHATVQQLVAAEAITALVRELALQSQLVARDGAHWLLRVERESLNQPTARERLRAALEAAGHATQISVEVGRVIDSPARRNAAAAAERQRVAEETVMNDPYVQTLMREHGAKIVPGSIKPL